MGKIIRPFETMTSLKQISQASEINRVQIGTIPNAYAAGFRCSP